MTIERIRAVIDAATPGRWDVPRQRGPFIAITDAGVYVYPRVADPNGPQNRDAIIVSHNLMPELLALWEAAAKAQDLANWHEEMRALRAALAALDAKAEEVLG